jgi:predicted amidophosphoribosyltransferase
MSKIKAEKLDLCEYCGTPLDREGANCIICNKRMNTWKRIRCLKLHEEGKCTSCSVSLDREGWFCKKCVESLRLLSKRRSDERRKNGPCVQCGKPSDGYSQCRECLDKLKERRRKKRGE